MSLEKQDCYSIFFYELRINFSNRHFSIVISLISTPDNSQNTTDVLVHLKNRSESKKTETNIIKINMNNRSTLEEYILFLIK